MKGFQLFPIVLLVLCFTSIHSASAIWTLTNLTSTWQGQTYWQFPLNFTAGATNIYHLQLAAATATPGTISIFTNSNLYYLPDIYVSTNCSTVVACPAANFTSLPTSATSCWDVNTGNTSMWQMNVATSASCDIYFQMSSNPDNVTVQFTYLPQFALSSSQNYSNLPVYWIATAEQFYTYTLPAIYATTTGATFTVNFNQISSYVVTSMYIGSNDSAFQLGPCNYAFPAANQTCARTSTPYTNNSAQFLSFTTYLNSAASVLVLGFVAGQNDTLTTFSLASTVTMVCKQGYIQQGNTCIQENSKNLTNTTSTLQPSNQRYWNISLVPAAAPIIYELDLDNSLLPGTFYLNSANQLPNVYISTDCNATTTCLSTPTIQPSAADYCFMQQTGASSFQMNNLLPQYPNVTTGCSYYFVFPAGGATMNVQMEYFPIQNISDYTQIQYFYIPWATSVMPRYFIYELPLAYSSITAAYVSSFTVQIQNVDENLIQNVYFSSNDANAGTNCVFTPFPNSASNCSMLQSVKTNATGNYYTYTFNLKSAASINYLAFYVQQNNTIQYLNATLNSVVNCIANYTYSATVGDCIQIVNIPLTSNFTQYGGLRYLNVQPVTQAGKTNIFSVNLQNTDEPGTFYVGTTQGQSMPLLYISSNCTTACQTYTQTPTSTAQCWNTSYFTDQYLTTYFNVNPAPKGLCSTYFSLENATGSEQLIIAYFPVSFPIMPGNTSQQLLFPWQNYPAPRYILPQLNFSTISQAVYSAKFQMWSLNVLNVSQTPSLGNNPVYLASKDPKICDGNYSTSLFPGPTYGCGGVYSAAVINATNVENFVYNLEYATSGVSMAIYGQSSTTEPSLTFYYSTSFSCVLPAVLINGSCVIQQPVNLTDITSQVTNSTTGNYWNLSLTATGEPQIFQIELTTANIPGSFYWSQNQIYPAVFVTTNCTAACQYNSSQNASQQNYCAQTPSTTANAWQFQTDPTIATGQCFLQFYLEAQVTTNQNFNFMYYPEKIVSDGNNTAIFNWNPTLYRYFSYTFNTTFQAIPFASFQFTLSIPIASSVNNVYFGTSDQNSQCNFAIPSLNSHCQDITTGTTNTTISYGLVINNSSSTIYIAIPSNSTNPITFSIAPSFTCFTGYYQPTGQMTCKVSGACPAGQYYDDTANACTACSTTLSNCAICTTSTLCTECTNTQFALTGGKCVAVCEAGQYPNPAPTTTTSVCLPCMQHCVQCTTNLNCQECYEPTYIWNTTTNNCTSVCPAGSQYYNAITKQCVACEVQYCIVCYGSGKQCNGCQSGYTPVQLATGEIQCQQIQTKPKSGNLLQTNIIAMVLLLAFVWVFRN